MATEQNLVFQVVGESGLFTPEDISYVQDAGVKAVSWQYSILVMCIDASSVGACICVHGCCFYQQVEPFMWLLLVHHSHYSDLGCFPGTFWLKILEY